MCSHVSLPKTGTWYVRERKRNMSENSSSTHRCPLLSEENDKNLSCQEKRCKNRKNQARQKLFQMEAKICAANATQNTGHTHTHVANKINAWLKTRVDSSGTVMYMSDVKPHD